MAPDLLREIGKYRKRVDEAIKAFLPPSPVYARQVRKAMEYSLLAGGKRVRPILCLLACQAVGGGINKALPAACALEYIHTYSLIHDDLPALDNDDFRRGKPTCHKKFGQATAILAGDALLTEAFVLLSRPGLMKTLPAAARLRIIRETALAAGIQGMVAGQEADLGAERKKISLDHLNFIHSHKTGALISASLVCGGLAGEGSPPQIRALKRFGEKIGLAFQIRDDLLNVEGQSKKMGKMTGTDEEKSKATYPRLLGVEASRIRARDLLAAGRKDLRIFQDRALPLIGLGEYILARDK